MSKLKFGYVSILSGFHLVNDWNAISAFAETMIGTGHFNRICVIIDTSIPEERFVAKVGQLQDLGFEVTGVSVAGAGHFAGSEDPQVRETFIAAKIAEGNLCAAAGICAHGGPWLWPWLDQSTKLDDLAGYTERAVESLAVVAKAVPGVSVSIEAVSKHETPYFFRAADVRQVVAKCRAAGATNVNQLVDICHLSTSGEVGEDHLGKIEQWLPDAIKDGAVGLVHISAAFFRGHPLKANQPNEQFVRAVSAWGYAGPIDVEIFLPTDPLRGLISIYAFTIDGTNPSNVGTFARLAQGEEPAEGADLKFLIDVATAHSETAIAVEGWINS